MEMLRYLALRWSFGLFYWLGRRFTPAGRLALAGLAVSAILGLDTNQSMAYQTFTFLLALLALCAVCGLSFRARFSVRRTLPRFGTAGQPLPYLVSILNQGRRALRGLELMEDLADPRPSFAEYRAASSLSDRDLPLIDRFLGYNRWLKLLRLRKVATAAPVAVPELPPNGQADISAAFVPLRRGRLLLKGVAAARPDPLGLVRALASEPREEAVLILPKRYPVPRISLPGPRRYHQGGVALSSSVGESQEFMSLRDYRPGDPLRRIHWRSWARQGKPIVKEYQDEYFVRHALVLDTFIGGQREEVFEEAVSVASSLACSVLTQESLLDLLFVGTEAFCFTAGRGLGGADRMLEILACVEPCRDKGFVELHHAVAKRLAGLSGCICVFLQWDQERRGFVAQLKALRIPVVPMVVCEPGGPVPDGCHRLELGKVAEGLAKL